VVGDDGFLVITPRIWIPEMSEEQIIKLGSKIKPIKRFGGILCHIKTSSDLFGPCFFNSERTKDAVGLKRIHRQVTYHAYGHRPTICLSASIAEIVAQIPERLIDRIVAFEVEPELKQNPEALAAGYHTAVTWFYEQEQSAQLQ